MGIVELNGGVGIDGIIGRQRIDVAAIKDDTLLALYALGSHHFHLLLILQVERSPLPTGQIQAVEFYLSFSGCLQQELSVIALALQQKGELVVFVQALNAHSGTIYRYLHAVCCRLLNLCRRTVVTDGDVLSVTDTVHQQGQRA